MIPCSICLPLSGLFHLTQHPPVSSTLLQMAGLLSFLRLNNIPLCVCVCVSVCVCVCVCVWFSLFIHPSTDTWVVSIPWLLWIMLQWTWEYGYLFKTMILFPLDIYREVGLLDHMVVLFLISWGTSILYSIVIGTTIILNARQQPFWQAISTQAQTCRDYISCH